MGYDSSLRVIYANGMDSHYQTEPHILAGAANPTVARRNMSLPGENGQNLVEWRFRKEQTRGKVIVFGRKLRVSFLQLLELRSFKTPWLKAVRMLTHNSTKTHVLVLALKKIDPMPPESQLPDTDIHNQQDCKHSRMFHTAE